MTTTTYIDNEEEIESMLHNEERRPISNNGGSNKWFKFSLILIGLSLIGCLVTLKNINSEYNDLKNYSENINCFKENMKNSNNSQFEVEGFMPLYTNGTKGPITTNRELDDGKKKNIYSYILENNEEDFNKFYYDIKSFLDLPETIEKEEEYSCEMKRPYENKGTILICPEHYGITIDDAFFGRYANDLEHCQEKNKDGELRKEVLYVEKNCGVNVKDRVKSLCEGKTRCKILSTTNTFSDSCPYFSKYAHIKYHCARNKEMKKPRFLIVMYADRITPNTIYEHSISEFYQYADIHGYKFKLNNNKYDDEREVFYMKLYVVQEAIINGLKNKEYDWVFWVDGDVSLANPNIKLETFLPKDNDVNFIIAADHNGINAGVFLIRVCSWSLNFMARSIAYQYYNINKEVLFADQTSMNNVLLEGEDEKKHYVIVPQSWFNVYPGWKSPGDMIIHFAGRKNKTEDVVKFNEELDQNRSYFSAKTNKSLRKEVLEYYDLPREQQGVTYIDNDRNKEKQY